MNIPSFEYSVGLVFFRERKEAEERKRLGIEEPQEDEDEDVVMGDPFKAVDKKTLQKQVKIRGQSPLSTFFTRAQTVR